MASTCANCCEVKDTNKILTFHIAHDYNSRMRTIHGACESWARSLLEDCTKRFLVCPESGCYKELNKEALVQAFNNKFSNSIQIARSALTASTSTYNLPSP